MSIRTLSLLAVILGASACQTFRPDAGFDEVSLLVTDRVGMDVVWRTGGEEDEKVSRRVAEMLARPLSADDVVQVTLLNNLELLSTYQELGIAQADVVQAGLLSNPSIGIERRSPGKALEADVALGFLDAFLIPLRRRVAGAGFEAAKLRVSKEIVEHAFEARQGYFELQEKMQLAELREKAQAATEASAESARRLREAGNVPLLDVQREELLAGEAKLELASAEGEVVTARERLNRLMGLWGKATGWTIPRRLPELPKDDAVPEQLEPVAIESRLDLAAARRELEGAAESVGIARIAALIPDLTLTGHYEREPEGSDSTGPSLELPLPLFNWGRAASGQARARFSQAERKYTALAIDIRSEVRAAYARMKVARGKAAFYRHRVLPLQEEALKQTQLQFNGMLVGVFQVLEAKRSQIEAAEKFIESLHDYWEARTELEAALGRTLPLVAPAEPVADPVAPKGASAHASQHAHH